MTKKGLILGAVLLVCVIVILHPAAALKYDKTPVSYTHYTPSKEYIDYINAPVITPEQKVLVQNALETTDVFKKYADVPRKEPTYAWAYPYSGKIYVSTIIGSSSSEVYGLLWSDIDAHTGKIQDYGFSNWNKYW